MDPVPMGDIPAHYAARLGEGRLAVAQGSEVVGWGELERRARRRAWALKASGVRQDDLVTIAMPNGVTFFELTFALWKLGATPHVVSSRLPPAELDAILQAARPRLLITPYPELADVFGGLDPAAHLDGDDERPLPPAVATHWKAMSSGGSTGRPKIIIDRMPGAIDPDVDALLLPRDKLIVNPGPLHHNAPFAASHRALFRGNGVVSLARFDAEETLRLIDRHKAAWINLVPTMMLRIWRLPEAVRLSYDLTSLERVWHMAAPMPSWLKQAWIEWLGPERIWELYGGTEAQGATILSGVEWLTHRGSVGKPVRCAIRIIDDLGEQAPPGVVGEIYMRPDAGPKTTYHYVGADARADPDGYESIGDFGWLDEDGYLYLADRRTDLILRGGANVYPAEVESALLEHDDVEQAVVIGLPDDDLGARVHAIVRLHKPELQSAQTEQTLREFVATRLAVYKAPASYEFTREELRDEAGKVRRSQLRDARI